MKLPRILLLASVLLLALFTLSASAATHWDKDDHEIFELQSALERSEGKGATFYSVLNIPRTASAADIKRAYRKKSVELHPDKNAGVAGAQQRFERLGLVYKILRDGRKDRYDHFVAAGFPKWRNNGYFYERYRPGLGAVIVGVVLATMLVEVAISSLTTKQERAKIERLKMSARLVAWGPRYAAILASIRHPPTPPATVSKLATAEKKVRVPITGFSLPAFPSDAQIKSNAVDWDALETQTRNVLVSTSGDGAPIVDCLVHGADVLLLDKFSGDYIALDEDDAQPAQFHTTWPFRLVAALANKVTGKHEDVLTEVDETSQQPAKTNKKNK